MEREQRTQLKRISLNEALEAFILDRQARRLASSTIALYREKLENFIRWADGAGVTAIDDVDARALRRFLLHLEDAGHNAGGQHLHARVLRAWLNFLVDEGIIPVSPMKNVRMPKRPKPSPRVLTVEEVNALLDAADNDRDKAIILALLDTGARISEFVALNVGDVDALGAVKIHHGKGDKARTVYLGFKALRALRRYLWTREDVVGDSSPLWTSFRDGERMTANSVRLMLKRVCKRAGVKTCNPHAFRATFALWALRSGMDIYTLARLMGHSDIVTLRHYLALAEMDAAAAHRRHGPVNGYLSKENSK